MQTGTIKSGITLRYRDGVGTSYAVLGTIKGGDQVIGTIDPLTNWFTIDHLMIDGAKANPARQAYCSAYNASPDGYYSSIVDYVPPVVPDKVFEQYIDGVLTLRITGGEWEQF